MKSETFMTWGHGQSSGLEQTHLGSNLDSAMDHPGDPGHGVTSEPQFPDPGRVGTATTSLPSLFLPGESQGLGSLAGCRLWGRTESDTTEATQQQQQQQQRVNNEMLAFTLCHIFYYLWRFTFQEAQEKSEISWWQIHTTIHYESITVGMVIKYFPGGELCAKE